MLTPQEMDQIRELIRYDVVIHQTVSSSGMFIVGAIGTAGGWLISRWRQKKQRGICPICNNTPKTEVCQQDAKP